MFTLLAVFALTVGMLASPASAEDPIECGDTITHSVTLTADLGPCPGDGLIVGADGITIDLGGHTLTGSRPAELFVDDPFSYGFGVLFGVVAPSLFRIGCSGLQRCWGKIVGR
jgi:hypothetical protein